MWETVSIIVFLFFFSGVLFQHDIHLNLDSNSLFLHFVIKILFVCHRWLESAGGSTSLNSLNYLTRYEMTKIPGRCVLCSLVHCCGG